MENIQKMMIIEYDCFDYLEKEIKNHNKKLFCLLIDND